MRWCPLSVCQMPFAICQNFSSISKTFTTASLAAALSSCKQQLQAVSIDRPQDSASHSETQSYDLGFLRRLTTPRSLQLTSSDMKMLCFHQKQVKSQT